MAILTENLDVRRSPTMLVGDWTYVQVFHENREERQLLALRRACSPNHPGNR